MLVGFFRGRSPPQKIESAELRRATALAYEHCPSVDGNIGFKWNTALAEGMWDPAPPAPLDTREDRLLFFTTLGPFQELSWCRDRVEEYLTALGLQVDEDSRGQLAKAISFGTQKAMLTLQRRARGDFSPDPSAPTATVAPAQSNAAPTNAPVKFSVLVEGWAKEKNPSQKTLYAWKRVIDQICAFIGHSDAARLTPDDLLRWKAELLEDGLHTKTIRDSKIAPLRAIFQWGVDNRKLSTNPASKITVDVRTRLAERIRGFTDLEAATILQHASKAEDPVRRWVPLLCAYSGARLSEVCQLRGEDIVELNGFRCMKFDPEAGSLKNENSERAVPLHPAIIASGFLEFVASVGSGPLFASLPADRFGNRGGTGTKVIGRWVRGLGLMDERISPSHSWRHRFKTLGRQFGLAPDIVNAITGHHRKTVADSYGEFPIDALFRELSKIPEMKFQ